MPFKDMYQDLSDLQILQFANNWYDKHVGHPGDCERKKNRFQETWKRDEIEELVGNSVLLEMFVKLNNYCEPPTNRNELYKLLVQISLNNWDIDRVLNGTKYSHGVITTTDKTEILIHVAAGIYVTKAHDRISRLLSTESQLEQVITIALGRIVSGKDCKMLSQQIVEQMKSQDGILYYAGENHWGFAHQRFFEYFLAQYFLSLFHKRVWDLSDLCHLFVKHSDDERWHGMLSLLAGALQISFIPKVLETLLSLDSDKQEYGNVFLAARCVIEHKWWNEIADSVSVLQEHLVVLTRNPAFRLKALDALKAVESHLL